MTACGCVRTMCNAMQTPLDSNHVQRARANEKERESKSEKIMSVEKMANGRSMYVWIVLYAVPVPIFLFVVIASFACK